MMNQRPTRSTRSKIVYTEVDPDQSGFISEEGKENKRRKKNRGTEYLINKKKSSSSPSSDSSSLTSLEDFKIPRLNKAPFKPPHRKRSFQQSNRNSAHGPRIVKGLHTSSYHTLLIFEKYNDISTNLLSWFDKVKEDRNMPWRKEIKDISTLTEQQKGQRAYEVWVSEIMLQQTQVETVKSYYLKWINRFPTIFELSKANIEQVNEYWQGLGYYSRASRLLSGAKKVVEKFKGILPEDPSVMEKEVDGIGPYSAGAIASIAYTKPVPMVDGNVHRVLSRLAALHAPQTAKATTAFLWSLAAKLVPQQRPGDFNQALMELGATVCKPREALCSTCPLTQWCRAYQEQQDLLDPPDARASESTPSKDSEDIEDICGLCQPLESVTSSSSDRHVLIYPMAKERKKPAIREVAVAVVLWKESGGETNDYTLKNILSSTGRTKTLLIKRPEKGLLAGLWEFPSIDLPESNNSTAEIRFNQIKTLLKETLEEPISILNQIEKNNYDQNINKLQVYKEDLPNIHHIFSHLKVTYKSIALLIISPNPPRLKFPNSTIDSLEISSSSSAGHAIWLPSSKILSFNIGNPHKKIWNSFIESS